MNIYHRHFTLVLIILYCGFINAKLGARDFMFCGGVSTAVTDFLLFPVDTIKVTQQNSHIGISIKEACHQIFNRGNGLGGFYKGALGYSLVDGCGSAVFFAVYEHVKGLAANHLSGPLLGASNYASAAAAFVASSIFLVPAEVLKTRMQTQSFDSIAICLRDSLTRERGGILGLYSGYKAALIRDLPYFALQLGFYDSIRDFMSKKVEDLRIRGEVRWLPSDGIIDLAAGVSAGFLTGFLTNPADVVTARLMSQQADFAKEILPAFRSSVRAPYSGFQDACGRIMREEGPRGFLSGVNARVAWIAPFVAISLCLNNYLRREIEKQKMTTEPLPLALNNRHKKKF